MIEFLQKIDVNAFLFLNSLHNPFFDKLMWFVSGKYEWIPLYLALVFWIFYRFRKTGWIILALTLIVFALSDAGSVHLFKNVFLRLRPSRNPDLEGMVHIVNGYRGGLYGFISAHSANTFGLAVFMSLVFRKRWFVISILSWATVVSYSRIYLGVHYPGDILCGAIWGCLMAWLVFYLYKKISEKLPAENKKFVGD